jgi:hypothetical protein
VHNKLSRALVALAIAISGAAACDEDADVSPARVPETGQALQDFQTRIDAYVRLREQAQRDVPKLEETQDPGKIVRAQEALGAKVREARADAKAGDIFTPAVRERFRQLMYPEIQGPGSKTTREAIKEDAPSPSRIPLKVNANYPPDAPLPTVPPNLLASLPQLPDDLEYRIVGRDLILLDVRANLIVDFIPDAIRQ